MSRSYKRLLYIIILIILTIIYLAPKIFNSSAKWRFDFTDSKLKPIVESRLKDQKGNFAIYVESLDDEKVTDPSSQISSGRIPNKGIRFEYNSQTVFPAGSLYKLFLLSAAFKEIEQQNLSEDDQISASVDHLQEVLGSKDFGYEDVDSQISYSVSEILERIATISDNYASIMLAEKINWDKVREMAKTIGATQTSIKDPISTSASDIATFYKKLYQCSNSPDQNLNVAFISKDSCLKIIDLLARSKINNRIPAKLPQELKIAHKTAELSRTRHDSGIVFLDQKPYVIVLMSTDLEFEDDGVELLSDLSKDIYDYFNE